MNHGFLPDQIQPEDYVLGAQRQAPIVEAEHSGQWDEYLPGREIQHRDSLETMNCTSYGTLNAIEILERARYGAATNYSDRYVGIMAGTTPQGNSPHKVAETIRKVSGLVPEEMLPFREGMDWNTYYSPQPMDPVIAARGETWLDTHVFKHEWVFTSGSIEEKRDRMKAALTLSPLCVSVYAWQRDGSYYTKAGNDNHWVTIFGYEDGKYWKAFDSYDDTVKFIEWGYDFSFAKRYHVERVPRKNWIADLVERFCSFSRDIAFPKVAAYA